MSKVTEKQVNEIDEIVDKVREMFSSDMKFDNVLQSRRALRLLQRQLKSDIDSSLLELCVNIENDDGFY